MANGGHGEKGDVVGSSVPRRVANNDEENGNEGSGGANVDDEEGDR